MRSAVVTLALIALGGQSLALADPPVAPAAAAQTPAAAVPAPAAAAQTPAVTPAKPASTASAASTSDERIIEQQLRLQGYRLSMVRGQELYCRREAPLGSRLESVMHCMTLAEAEVMAHEGKETTEQLQRRQPGCLNAAAGGCGK